ncbi:tyrosine-type recombinase/integrase [bacterium]|nr:tyrosine-type recombinase/integrase [bacterium]
MKKIETIGTTTTYFEKSPRRGIWSCYFTTYAGRRIRFSTKQNVFARAREVAATRVWEENGRDKDPHATPDVSSFTLFREYRKTLKARGRAESTLGNIERFERRFEKFFGCQSCLPELTKQDIERWAGWLRQQKVINHKRETDRRLGHKTVSEHINWLSAVYNYYDLKNPVKRVHRPKKSHSQEVEERKIYYPEEVRKILKSAKERSAEGDDWRLFELMTRIYAFTGLRYSELMGLQFSDVDKQNRQVLVAKNKKRETRNLTLTGDFSGVWNDLQTLIGMSRKHHGKSWQRDLPIIWKYHNWYRKTLKYRFCPAEKIEYKGVHAYRHGFASNALMRSGWSLDYLAKWLGHDRSVCFRLYSHLIPEEPPGFEY